MRSPLDPIGIAFTELLHPEGPSLQALGEEYGEVCSTLQDEPERVAEELLQVAAVAVRWYMNLTTESRHG